VEAAKLGFLTYLKERMNGEGSVFDPRRDENVTLSTRKDNKPDDSGCAC